MHKFAHFIRVYNTMVTISAAHGHIARFYSSDLFEHPAIAFLASQAWNTNMKHECHSLLLSYFKRTMY